jgi:hypothetical protein
LSKHASYKPVKTKPVYDEKVPWWKFTMIHSGKRRRLPRLIDALENLHGLCRVTCTSLQTYLIVPRDFLASVPNGALWTNKLLMHIRLIYPWSRLTKLFIRKAIVMHTNCYQKGYTFALTYRLFQRFQKGVGDGSRGVYNLICRSLFHYYSDLFYYSTMFPSTLHYFLYILPLCVFF